MTDYYETFQDAIARAFIPVERLSKGPRGEVTRLRHRESGEEFLLRSYQGEADPYRRLLGISCASLPRVYEVVQQDQKVAELEEFIHGDALEQGTLAPGQCIKIARELCAALYTLHSVGVIHRDVKPENVLLRGDGAVLIDLDASRVFQEDRSHDTVILGTVGYAAPEQFGLSQTDPRSDIFSLGVTLNVMLTGRHPVQQLASGKLGRIIRRCTQTSPDKRYRSVSDLLEALG